MATEREKAELVSSAEILSYINEHGFYKNHATRNVAFDEEWLTAPDLHRNYPADENGTYSPVGYSVWIDDSIALILAAWHRRAKMAEDEGEIPTYAVFQKQWSLFKSFVDAYLGNDNKVLPAEVWFGGYFSVMKTHGGGYNMQQSIISDNGLKSATRQGKHAEQYLRYILKQVQADKELTSQEADFLSWASVGRPMVLFHSAETLWGGPEGSIYQSAWVTDEPTITSLRSTGMDVEITEGVDQHNKPIVVSRGVGINLLHGASTSAELNSNPGWVHQAQFSKEANGLVDGIIATAIASEKGLALLSPTHGHIIYTVVDEMKLTQAKAIEDVTAKIEDFIQLCGTPNNGQFKNNSSSTSGVATKKRVSLTIGGTLFESLTPKNSNSASPSDPGHGQGNLKGGNTGTWRIDKQLLVDGGFPSAVGIPGWAIDPIPTYCPDKAAKTSGAKCSWLADVGGFNSDRNNPGEGWVNTMTWPKQVMDYNHDFAKSLSSFTFEGSGEDFTKYPFIYNKTYSSGNWGTEVSWKAILMGGGAGATLAVAAWGLGAAVAAAGTAAVSAGATGTVATTAAGAGGAVGTSTVVSAGLLGTALGAMWSIFAGMNPDISMNDYLQKVQKAVYFVFIKQLLHQASREGSANVSVGQIYDKIILDENHIKRMAIAIIMDKEVHRRVAKWQKSEEQAAGLTRPATDAEKEAFKGLNDPDLQAAASAAGVAAFKTGAPPEIVELEQEELEERQKFFKQCALMLNAHTLKTHLRRRLQGETNPKKKMYPFNGRFWMARCDKDQERLVTNLVAASGSAELFEIPPHVMTYLTPKVRLFRVSNKKKGELSETEFVFDTTTDINRTRNYTRPQGSKDGTAPAAIPDSFAAAVFDKGEGCGLQEFSFEFNGTNPAEARNDITAKLKLFFQSFTDFVRERKGYNGQVYRYVDLVLQPTPSKDGTINDLKIVHPHQYDPSFYRIRAEVGYNIPGPEPPIPYAGWDNLRTALSLTNRSFYLNMVDHDINVNSDGTVVIDINYRAYVETALKTQRFDALSTPELIRKKLAHAKKLRDILNKKICNAKQIKELKAAMKGEEVQLREQSLRSVISRLLKRDRIYVLQVRKGDATHFREKGYFDQCVMHEVGKDAETSAITPSDVAKESPEVLKGMDQSKLTSKLPAEDAMAKADRADTTVQYFFFGDLLHTILDTMFDGDPKSGSLVQGMENTRIILGSFDFDPYSIFSGDTILNIAQIPISLDYFSRWYKDQILDKGKTRETFPILNFIRNLCNNLLQATILESCVNQKLKKSTAFTTGQISAYSDNKDVDPLQKLVTQSEIIINTDAKKGKGLPLKGDSDNELRDIANKGAKANHFYNYLILNVLGSSLTFSGEGKYGDDIKNGRFHIDIGSNKGIVKTVSFSKTDMKYGREARFFQEGIDGLLQLSVLYKITVEMFGNTLFYPGMELYLNPYGIGGMELGSPTQGKKSPGGRSLANKLGIGGYHTILNVKSSIKPGNFSTTIQAQQYYSGDGSGNPNVSGEVENINAQPAQPVEDTKEPIEQSGGENRTAACDSIIADIEWRVPTEGASTTPSVEEDEGSGGSTRQSSGTTTTEPIPAKPQAYEFLADPIGEAAGILCSFVYDDDSGTTADGLWQVYKLEGVEVAHIMSQDLGEVDGIEQGKTTLLILKGIPSVGYYYATWANDTNLVDDPMEEMGDDSGPPLPTSPESSETPTSGDSTGSTQSDDQPTMSEQTQESESITTYILEKVAIDRGEALSLITGTGGTETSDGITLAWGFSIEWMEENIRATLGMKDSDILEGVMPDAANSPEHQYLIYWMYFTSTKKE